MKKKNPGDSSMNVIAIKASVHLPFDHKMLVQNLTAQVSRGISNLIAFISMIKLAVLDHVVWIVMFTYQYVLIFDQSLIILAFNLYEVH